jgi:S-adenosylmethionine:diacylglycerol 3-amino-3-carboxypropyl transferase
VREPVADTPWKAGRFDQAGGPKKILFGRVYEDVAIELEAFPPGARVFCIASAGCTAIALSSRHEVTAVDINPVQLEYARGRAHGAPMLRGSAERLMAAGRKLLPLAGWHRRTIEQFLTLESPAEQMSFWNAHLNTRRFRYATDAMFSLTWLGTVYASALLSILPPRFGSVMRARLERCWSLHPNRSNSYARALLLGELDDRPAPATAADIHFECTDAAAFLESCPAAGFQGFVISNILDGAPTEYRRRLFAAVQRAASPDAMIVQRSFAEPAEASRFNAAPRDRSLLWGIVDVRPVTAINAISEK